MTKQNDLYKNLGKIFNEKDKDSDIKDIPEEERGMYLDECQIMGVIPKKKRVDSYIKENFEVEKKPHLPKIGYTESALFPAEYMKYILNIIKNQDYVRVSVKKDAPLKIETDEVEIYLAPNIGDHNL